MKVIFKGQLFNLFLLYFLLAGVFQVISNFSGFLDGSYLGLSTKKWLFLAVSSPILHQYYVWFCWRFQLYQNTLTDVLGKLAFPIYKVGFAILILSRLVLIVALAISNQDSMQMDQTLGYVIAFVLAIPALYLFYSVKAFFGMDRAFGIDHFDPEAAKSFKMVKEGIFKYTSNGMYVYGFFVMYLPAFIWLSKAALIVAIFNHLFIWVHYYFTEKPDMEFIYGTGNEE